MKLTKDSIVIYPTDTVWGIGGSIYSEDAYKKIAAIKKTAEDKPLSVMFTDIKTLYKSFNFPDFMDASWLRNYFKLESTLGLPRKIAKISIPSWVTGKSELVSVRCLEWDILKPIGAEFNGPFFTTSLNNTGEAPIVSYDEALSFQKNFAPEAFFFGERTHNLSGRSSTIVFFRGSHFEIIREGIKVEEIKKQLKLTGLKVT